MRRSIVPARQAAPARRVRWYLLFVALLSLLCFLTLDVWLLPYAVAYRETGAITAGYLLYVFIGLFFSTPTPFWAVILLSVFVEKTDVQTVLRRMIHTERKGRAFGITAGFCLLALLYAVLFGKPNGSPWYLFPIGFLVMIPLVGIAEETGWRGFLQPELEKRMPFPLAVLVTAAIWYAWHFPVWIDPTSNHYGDSMIGFAVTIGIWAFAAAALYRATESVLACAVYHAFLDAIGAVYDWNALFDAFPGSLPVHVYRVVWLAAAVALLYVTKRKSKPPDPEGIAEHKKSR